MTEGSGDKKLDQEDGVVKLEQDGHSFIVAVSEDLAGEDLSEILKAIIDSNNKNKPPF